MSTLLEAVDVERFRSFVGRRFGFQLDETKLGSLADILRRRLEARGGTCSALLDRIENDESAPDLRAIIAELTVPETYFFRNIQQFHAFTEVALPARIEARASTRALRILSAGCASGEEPYTLAILMREAALDPSWKVSITAVDLNRVVLEKAARGRFTRWALRETPAEVQRRWFRTEGSEIILDESIRSAVTFEAHNLVADRAALGRPETFDVVFWRNVMMYFTPEHARAVVARLTRLLAPGGYLFLGHAETLRGISNDFHLRHTHDTFYYQRKVGAETQPLPTWLDDAGIGAAAPEPLAAVFEGADSWVDTIQRASARIRVLSDDSRSSHAPEAPLPRVSDAAAPAAPAWNLTLALELLEKERFADALALVHGLPPESARDPQVQLLRAVLLTHSGQLESAEQACHALLVHDELDAGAHYLLALCREGAGDRQAATDHDQIAAYLDPAFAMPRLHLGLLARRANDRENARHDLGQALVLLQREDASRLLLFGGGFGRAALIALCRAELVTCGGTP